MDKNIRKMMKKLSKEDNPQKAQELIRSLAEFNKIKQVNDFLLEKLLSESTNYPKKALVHAINPDLVEDFSPFEPLLQSDSLDFSEKEQLISLLRKSEHETALKVLLSSFKKEKDTQLLDSIVYALTFFQSSKINSPVLKALKNEKLRLQALTGLAINEYAVLSSKRLLTAIVTLIPTERFERIQHEIILQNALDAFSLDSIEQLQELIANSKISKHISKYKKSQRDVTTLLSKIDVPKIT